MGNNIFSLSSTVVHEDKSAKVSRKYSVVQNETFKISDKKLNIIKDCYENFIENKDDKNILTKDI